LAVEKLDATVVDENGLATFEMLCSRHHDHAALLCAFDLLELDGEDLRRERFEVRKAAPCATSARCSGGGRCQCPYEAEGAMIHKHACAFG
jgi:ATP-dependent DNA ligase